MRSIGRTTADSQNDSWLSSSTHNTPPSALPPPQALTKLPCFQPGYNGHQEPGQKNLPWLMIFFARPFALGVSANLKSFSRRIDFFFQTNFFARVHMIRAFSAALILYYRSATMRFQVARPRLCVCLFVSMGHPLRRMWPFLRPRTWYTAIPNRKVQGFTGKSL